LFEGRNNFISGSLDLNEIKQNKKYAGLFISKLVANFPNFHYLVFDTEADFEGKS